MRRTPPWVFVAAAGIQLAALGLCVWAMESLLRIEAPKPKPAPRPAPPPAPLFVRRPVAEPVPEPVTEPAPEPETAVAAAAPPPAPEPVREPEPFREPAPRPSPPMFGPPPSREPARPEAQAVPKSAPTPWLVPPPRRPDPDPEPARRVTIRSIEPHSVPAPRFGPPPVRIPEPPVPPESIPRFITELADETSQIVGGKAAGGRITFGFYPDGNMRFVDADGGRYTGKAESARARLREIDGTRAFTVQISVAQDRRLQATFTGGTFDGETISLEPLVGWNVA